MDLKPHERARIAVRFLSKEKGITQAEIGKKMGYSNNTGFSAVLNGHKTLPVKFGANLCELFPEINPDFLSGMSDEILRPGYEQPSAAERWEQQIPTQEPAKPSGVYMPLELFQMFNDLSSTIRSQQETIRILVGKGDVNEKAV